MKKHKLYKGFTIIEVVLVLAIAGLIFLMVFLALPALQRSQRDTQQKQDVAMVVTALHNWKANNQGRGYASMGESILTPKTETELSEEDKKYGININIKAVNGSPLNSYIGFDIKSGKNKNDSSSSLSFNTERVTTSVKPDYATLFMVNSTYFRDHKRIAVVIGMGCDNMETLSDGKAILKDVKKGAAAVVVSLESGGAYCQEA